MARYWQSFLELSQEFQRLGIATSYPGFYDEPAFQQVERTDPELLNSYARFVNRREYSATYLQRARREIPFIAEHFRAAIAAAGITGACVDASMALSRMLDREGLWNYCVKGGLRIDYSATSGLRPSRFYQLDYGDHAAGHAWIVAPPFTVLDITIGLQEYETDEQSYLPVIVAADNVEPLVAETEVLMSPEICALLIGRGISRSRLLASQHSSWREFTRCFPPSLVRHGPTTLKYVPFGIGASDAPLEGITNRSYQGMLALDVYNAMQPSLLQFRSANP